MAGTVAETRISDAIAFPNAEAYMHYKRLHTQEESCYMLQI